MSKIYLGIIVALLSSCVSESELSALKAENEKLKKRLSSLGTSLNKCENGAEKTAAKIDQALKSKDFETAKVLIDQLKSDHPESKDNNRFSKKVAWVDKEIKKLAAKRKKEAEAERQRKNANNLGEWEVSYYVDDFGKPTKSGYIRNKNILTGSFSNSAVQGKKLNASLLLTKYTMADIKLYEYASQNPVKGYITKHYKVLVQDKDKKRYDLKGTLYQGANRITLDDDSSRKLHSVLKKGGMVDFYVKEYDGLSEYKFSVKNADWYYNAYKKLHNIK